MGDGMRKPKLPKAWKWVKKLRKKKGWHSNIFSSKEEQLTFIEFEMIALYVQMKDLMEQNLWLKGKVSQQEANLKEVVHYITTFIINYKTDHGIQVDPEEEKQKMKH